MTGERKKPHLVSVRLTDGLHKALEAAQRQGPYELSKATIIERGIVLALEELSGPRALSNRTEP